MTVYFDKARAKWRFDFEQDGERYARYALDPITREPVTSKRAAKEAETAERTKARLAPKLPAPGETTLAQVVASLTPIWRLQERWTEIPRYAREIVAFFGADKRIADLDQAGIDGYVAHARTRPVMLWKGGPTRDASDQANARYWCHSGKLRGPNTVNLYLGILRDIVAAASKLRDGETRELILRETLSVPELPVPKRKARPVPDAVLAALPARMPQHVVEAMTLTLFFGFRKSEVFGLEIGDVDFDAAGVRLFADDVKDNEDTFLPASEEAMVYLTKLVEQAQARGVRHLIAYRPYRSDPEAQAAIAWRPIKSPKRVWGRVMSEIEAETGRRWRWHDIRASFITHIARTSGQLAAQALARHSDYDTTRAYVEVADEFRRAAANRAGDRPALAVVNGGQSPTHRSHTDSISDGMRKAKALK